LSRLLELVQSQGAILVCPDYRLLPEATGLDILSDIDSFWSWFSANLESELTSHFNPILRPDFDRILVTGDSAGGFCAIQSILRHPELSVKAVIMPYPMLHLRSRHWTEKPNKPILGLPDASPPFCNSAKGKTISFKLTSNPDHPDTVHHGREPLKDFNN
jgi:acetyl esterase/lipase